MKNSCLFYHHKLNIQLFHESIQLVPKNQNNTINISRTALQDLNITDSVNCSVNHWMISLSTYHHLGLPVPPPLPLLWGVQVMLPGDTWMLVQCSLPTITFRS